MKEDVDVNPVEEKLVGVDPLSSSALTRWLVIPPTPGRGFLVLLVARPDGCEEHSCTVT